MMRDIEFIPNKQGGTLAGRLLVATPVVHGSCFDRSVIYLCAHNKEGAMGVIINYPVQNIRLSEIIDQLGIENSTDVHDLPIHFGGPVEANRGFVIHSDEFPSTECFIRQGGVAVTGSVSILHDLAHGKGPMRGMLALGYAGWSSGQLESEIEGGSWIVAPATQQILFEVGNELKWSLALASMGIDLGHLSTDVGHA